MKAEVAREGAVVERSMLTLWLILGVCLLPIIGATAWFYLGPQGERMNYGDVITPPKMLPGLVLAGLDGKPVQLDALRGKWTMVQIDGGVCATICREKLYKMRQVRLTQGKNMERVQRLWLVDDAAPLDESLLQDYAGTIVARADVHEMQELMRALPVSATAREHIWLVDPLGNVMLRYPPAADPSRMKNDLYRLLQVSRA